MIKIDKDWKTPIWSWRKRHWN